MSFFPGRKAIKLPVKYEDIPLNKRWEIREEYIRRQKGRCWYCNELLGDEPPHKIVNATIHEDLFPPEFFDHPIHLHHSHLTGMTIGAVHNLCNAYLWEYEGE